MFGTDMTKMRNLVLEYGYALSVLMTVLSVACAENNLSDECTPGSEGCDADGGSTTEIDPEAYSDPDEVMAQNETIHDEQGDCDVTNITAQISLSNSNIEVNGEGVSVETGKVTINRSGVYSISGSLIDGQIQVDTTDSDPVKLVLNNASITNQTGAAIYVSSASKVVLSLASGSENYIEDPASHTDGIDANGALTSTSDFTICGEGTLTVKGNYNDGIAVKDGLIIKSGVVNVEAVDDGIRGKDYLAIQGGILAISSGGDGLKSDNESDTDRGYVLIDDGTISVVATGDALFAQTDAIVNGGTLSLYSSNTANPQITSAKGIKGLVSVVIDGGSILVDAADDAIHSDNLINISGGALQLKSGDDGIHGDLNLTILGGAVVIEESYGGLEGQEIAVNGGEIHVSASDDGINVSEAETTTESSETTEFGQPGGGRMDPGGGGGFETCAACSLTITDGWVVIDADGDGLDSNGYFGMSGGSVIVNGPTNSANSAIDVNGDFSMNGGLLVSVHTEQMSDEIEGNSTQNVLKASLTSVQSEGTLVHIEDSQGTALLTFAPKKQWKALTFSSTALVSGTYELYTGGTAEGSVADGLYQNGTYSPGTVVSDFSVSSTLTTVGSASSSGFPRM